MGNKATNLTQASATGEQVTTTETITVSSTQITEQPVKKSKLGKLSAKKRLGIVGALLVIVAVAVALTSSQFFVGSVKLADYTSEKQGFSVMYPSGWLVDVLDNASAPTTVFSESFDPNDTSGGSANPAVLTVEKMNTNLPKDAFFQVYSGLISNAVKNGKDSNVPDAEYPTSSSQKEGNINGRDAVLVEADLDNFQYAQGLKGKKYVALVWVDNTLQYSVTFTAKKSDQKVLKQWDTISTSFKINQ